MKRIPKIVHMYWDGTPMSKLQTFTVTSFCKLNPDWRIVVHMDKLKYGGNNKYIPPYTGEDYFHIVKKTKQVTIEEVALSDYGVSENLHYILRSDILRYHWLYNEGGVWSDFDVIWLKSMDYLSMIVGTDSFGATLCMYDDGIHKHHNISILISAKGHEFYGEAINLCSEIQNNINKKPNHQEFGTLMFNRVYPKAEDALNKFPDMVNLKYETFFPYSIFNMGSLYLRTDLSYITDSVMCVHWFNGHKLSKEYVNSNKFSKDCSMTLILKNENLI